MKTVFVFVLALALAGCTASVTAGDATKAKTQDQTQADANLTAMQAFSQTLSAQAGQVDRLVDATISQVQTWQALATILVAALGLVVVALTVGSVMVAVLAVRRKPAPAATYVIQASAMPASLAEPHPPAIMEPNIIEVARQLRARRAAELPAAQSSEQGREGRGDVG